MFVTFHRLCILVVKNIYDKLQVTSRPIYPYTQVNKNRMKSM